MTDYRSLLDAMEDVDKVVFCAGDSEDHERELSGLKEVMRSFQDTRCAAAAAAGCTLAAPCPA